MFRAVSVGIHGYRVVGPDGQLVVTFGSTALQYGDGGKAHPVVVPSDARGKALEYAEWRSQDYRASHAGTLR